MLKNQAAFRTSTRLRQRENSKLKVTEDSDNLQTKKQNNSDSTKPNNGTATTGKRKNNIASLQDETSKINTKDTVKRSKRVKVEVLQSNSVPSEPNSKTDILHHRKARNIFSDYHQSTNSSSISQHDTDKSHSGLKLSDDDLLVKYNQKIEDLKKSNIVSTTHIFKILCGQFEKLRDVNRAAAMSKYMRNKFEYFGIPTPQRRASYADLWPDVRQLKSCDLRTLAQQTWFSPEREFHYFTVELLEREVFRIYEDEGLPIAESAVKTLDFVKMFIEHPSSWWDTVDALSSNVVGPLVKMYSLELLPEMEQWNTSSCFWLRRTSILYQLSYKNDTDADRLFRYCLKLGKEEEFFIRKAIGWALRQYYRTNPEAVRNFVLKNKSMLSPLSVKEALKHDK